MSRGVPIRSIIATAPIHAGSPIADICIVRQDGNFPIAVVNYWAINTQYHVHHSCGEYSRDVFLERG